MKLQDNLKLISITRGDLPPGLAGTQAQHSLADYLLREDVADIVTLWKKESNSIIWLSCKNEPELKKLKDKLSIYTIVQEFTEPDIGNKWTSITFIGDKNLRKKISYLPLSLKNI